MSQTAEDERDLAAMTRVQANLKSASPLCSAVALMLRHSAEEQVAVKPPPGLSPSSWADPPSM